MVRDLMKSVGIDIGSSGVKVVEVVATTRGVQVTSFREYPIGANPAFDSEIEILDILKGLSVEYDPARTRVVVALRQDFISARLKVFPFSERQKILKSLPFELEEDLPFSSDSAIYDARICQYLGSQAEILAVAAPKIRIQDALKRVQDAGLDVTLVSAEGLAFSNCFEQWAIAPKQSSLPPYEDNDRPKRFMHARVHIGHSRTLVLAYEDERLIGVRTILWGGKNVAEAIARRYEIPYVEAVSEMRKKAFILLNKSEASYDQILFSDTIANQVRELGRELKISLLEFQTELGGDVENVEITGGFSQTLNLHAYLTQILEMPVNHGKFLQTFTTLFEKTPQVEATIGVALGLAVEGLRRPKNPPVQFLRAELAKQGEGFAEVWNKWGTTVTFTATLFAIFFAFANIRLIFSEELSEHAKEAVKKQGRDVAGLQGRNNNEAGIRNYIKTQRKRAQEVKEIENVMRMNTSMDILKKISDITPNRNGLAMNIRKLHIIEGQVTIEGTAAKADEARLMENAMKGIAKGQVRASIGQPAPTTGTVSFSMAFDVDRGITTTTK